MGMRQLAVANGPNIFQMLLVYKKLLKHCSKTECGSFACETETTSFFEWYLDVLY